MSLPEDKEKILGAPPMAVFIRAVGWSIDIDKLPKEEAMGM